MLYVTSCKHKKPLRVLFILQGHSHLSKFDIMTKIYYGTFIITDDLNSHLLQESWGGFLGIPDAFFTNQPFIA
ncbi:hypothetical protein AWP73_16380 [Escherichia coli]|nr:hypothetical protein AWP73_16525 [Escherichia coli]OKW63330.1 hypothetical protein AWP73_16380 [Escherichia coli]